MDFDFLTRPRAQDWGPRLPGRGNAIRQQEEIADTILEHGGMTVFRGMPVAVQTRIYNFHEMAAAGSYAIAFYIAEARAPNHEHIIEMRATGLENTIVLIEQTLGSKTIVLCRGRTSRACIFIMCVCT